MPILALTLLGVSVLLAVLIVLDLTHKVALINPVAMAVYLPIAVNLPLVGYLIRADLIASWQWTMIVLAVLFLYVWIRLNVLPVRDGVRLGPRLRALSGAPPLLLSVGYLIIVLAAGWIIHAVTDVPATPTRVLVADAVYSVGCGMVLYLNGAIRTIVTSKSLSTVGRALIASTLWIPVIGWLIGVGAAGTTRREYRAALDRVAWEQTLPEGDLCTTAYPIVLVHGVGWRDYVAFNAWGRIPRYLKRFGANVFHGEQEAWGSIAQNGEHLASRVEQILDQTGADKINIIAHSKGGLDARYAISTAGLGAKVASLTTMNTPHRGVRFVDTATKIREPLYLKAAAMVNFIFGKAGDTAPDFVAATMSFRTTDAVDFNHATPDHPAVFYQSYTSVMSRAGSDRLLSVPHRIIKALGEENDGLVGVESAKWGEFRGILRSTTKRGIGHGDLVDMHREDYKGFNVLDIYIQIVADLKERGY